MEHSVEVNKAKYWHGGAPGLLVGDHIIPRSELPLENYDRLMEHSYDPTDLGRVYITTDRDFALGWAIRYGNMPTPEHGSARSTKFALWARSSLTPTSHPKRDHGSPPPLSSLPSTNGASKVAYEHRINSSTSTPGGPTTPPSTHHLGTSRFPQPGLSMALPKMIYGRSAVGSVWEQLGSTRCNGACVRSRSTRLSKGNSSTIFTSSPQKNDVD